MSVFVSAFGQFGVDGVILPTSRNQHAAFSVHDNSDAGSLAICAEKGSRCHLSQLVRLHSAFLLTLTPICHHSEVPTYNVTECGGRRMSRMPLSCITIEKGLNTRAEERNGPGFFGTIARR